MIDELKQLENNDVIVDFISSMEQRGCRSLLMHIKEEFPNHFQEMQVQMERIKSKQVASLLRGN